MTTDTIPARPKDGLRSEIKAALNRASAENPSGTPDYILAEFLVDCLTAFDKAARDRATWRGEQVELPALQRLGAVLPPPDPATLCAVCQQTPERHTATAYADHEWRHTP